MTMLCQCKAGHLFCANVCIFANLFKCNCLGADLLNTCRSHCLHGCDDFKKKCKLYLNRKVSFVVKYYLSKNLSKILEVGIMKITFAPGSAVAGRVT